MKTISYLIACKNCNGTGFVKNPEKWSTAAEIPCKVCGGSGIVTALETIYDCNEPIKAPVWGEYMTKTQIYDK